MVYISIYSHEMSWTINLSAMFKKQILNVETTFGERSYKH